MKKSAVPDIFTSDGRFLSSLISIIAVLLFAVRDIRQLHIYVAILFFRFLTEGYGQCSLHIFPVIRTTYRYINSLTGCIVLKGINQIRIRADIFRVKLHNNIAFLNTGLLCRATFLYGINKSTRRNAVNLHTTPI